ncbi:4-galactosyl-N-acetylglucosaminide 3-alpha-L-fucosyltransferase FUT6-like [Diprion similis]|uniref:4-galactosyl-N-acetylglucosaminide 3-alpha-L-fucosyltransferase FUT6-like n=1 Tax=Diprion similis TaxID=362088 RepID=UPI001EF76C63|nr:4-galactosyl-N-acetylglucosaminide 3-alpha-L-fucosyltransferase FUT6-like [Diprion similis]
MIRLPRHLQTFVILIAASLFAIYSLTVVLHGAGNRIVKLFDSYNNDAEIYRGTVEIGGGIEFEAKPIPFNWRNLSDDQVRSMSALGKRLLSVGDITEVNNVPRDPAKGYLIVVWKHGPFLERRHLKHFTNVISSPWEDCSVNNCRLSYDSEDVEDADAVLIHLHKTTGVKDLPDIVKPEKRMKQRWVFLTDESPLHTFLSGGQSISSYNGLFNWSMSYRIDSDVPVPYGRTVRMMNQRNSSAGSSKDVKTKTKLVAIMGSNCGGSNKRWNYAAKLKEALSERMDAYGHCLNGDTKTCPGHFAKDCEALEDYKFYLAFENSNCKEYLTEKPFWHGYHKHAVPVIMGASRENCRQLLPPDSYIHVDDFANPATLADYLLYLDQNHEEYSKFHAWRNHFYVVNEHGYFQSNSRHYCRLCEALNYNDPSVKVYNHLEEFWSKTKDCW